VQLFRPLMSSDYILGAVGVLQFDVIVARLKDEYGVDALYEGIEFATARWVSCADQKKFNEFEKKNQGNLALDAEGNLAFLAPSEWRLGYVIEQWPDIVFHKTKEHS
jgi:peptide chain release factor 3